MANEDDVVPTRAQVDDAIAAFDDDALLKMMLAQAGAGLREAFTGEGHPERILRARDRAVVFVEGTFAMREALKKCLARIESDIEGAGFRVEEGSAARAVLAKVGR